MTIFARSVAVAAVLSFLALPAAAQAPAVEQAWARPTTSMATAGGAFMTIRDAGGGADRLVTARSPVSERTELHTHIMDGGIARMREVEGGMELPAGGVIDMQPGGLHVMFIGLKAPLEPGSTVPLTLVFERAGELDVEVRVLKAGERPPVAAKGHHGEGAGHHGHDHGHHGGHRSDDKGHRH